MMILVTGRVCILLDFTVPSFCGWQAVNQQQIDSMGKILDLNNFIIKNIYIVTLKTRNNATAKATYLDSG
jgi:hypothetical protein